MAKEKGSLPVRRCPERLWATDEVVLCFVSGEGCGGGRAEERLLGVGFEGRGKGELGVEEVREMSSSDAVSSSESFSNDSLDW